MIHPFKTTARQNILDRWKAMRGLNKSHQRLIIRAVDRQRYMAAFRSGHDAAAHCGMHWHRVEPGADIHHQTGRLWAVIGAGGRARNNLAQAFRGKQRQGMAGGLQIVQQRHGLCPGRPGNAGLRHGPVQVGHFGNPVAHGARRRNAGPRQIGRMIRQIGAQDRLDPRIVAVCKTLDAASVDHCARSQRHAGIRAPNIGNKGCVM